MLDFQCAVFSIGAHMAHDHINIQNAAQLARLQLSEEEMASFQRQLDQVLDYMETLESYDLAGVEPTAHALPVYDVWREDEPREGFAVEEALLNAPRKAAGQFLVNRSVEDA